MGGTGKLLHASDFADWEKVIRTNLHGPFLCSKLAAKQFIKQIDASGKEKTEDRGKRSGNIINISSVHEEAIMLEQGACKILHKVISIILSSSMYRSCLQRWSSKSHTSNGC